MNWKQFSLYLWFTFMTMVTYTVLLATRATPLYEKTLIIWDTWEINLPNALQISHWWNLIFFPLIFIIAFIWNEKDEIFGREPNTDSIAIEQKYNARVGVAIVTILSFSIMMVYPLVFAFVDLFYLKYGPLSNLINGLITFLGTYIILGFAMSSLSLLFINLISFDKWNKDEEIRKFGNCLRFKYYILAMIKSGLFKNLPFILGATFGFTLRFVFSSVYKFFKNFFLFLKTA